MASFGNIPLPNPNNYEMFKDVMDYFEQLKKRKSLEQQESSKEKRLSDEFNQNFALNKPLKEAQVKHALAQAHREEALANLPFGGHQLITGPAGKAFSLSLIKDRYGENSPEYRDAKKSIELDEAKTKQSMDYQKSLIDSQPKRYSTTAGKTAQEENEIEQGFMPGTTSSGKAGVPLTEDQQKKLKGQYKLKQLKDSTDSSVRQRILYSKNMDKTLDNLNVDDLVSYSGIKGTGELLRDRVEAAKGNISPRYEKYRNALTAADTLAKQVRQFYGDSITAGVQEGLKKLTNPTEWLEHPKVAKSRFESFKKILKTEAKTFTDAAKSADIYLGEETEKVTPKSLTYNIETGEFE